VKDSDSEKKSSTQGGMTLRPRQLPEVFDRLLVVVKESEVVDAFSIAVLIWVALHSIVSRRLSKPGFPGPGSMG